MNSAITTPQTSVWKRIKAQHIAGAAGIALAVTVLTIGALSLDSNSPAAVPVRQNESISQPATGYPLVQEMSHQFAPVQIPETASGSISNGNPLVQEQSHPQVTSAADATPSELSPGAYPLVQEQSHPR
jgi:hypothetical protein